MFFKIISFRPLFLPTFITILLLALLLFLGTWQLERKVWKEDLLHKEHLIWRAPPISWKESSSLFQMHTDIQKFPSRQFVLKGRFLKSPSLLIPASLPSFSKEKRALQERIFTFLRNKKLSFYGYKVIQLFFMEGGYSIWVDRGWVPSQDTLPDDEERDIFIQVKLEPSPIFSCFQKIVSSSNNPSQNKWIYFSPQEASSFYHIEMPYNFYALETINVFSKQALFPVPVFEEKQMRNQHLTYALIWYSLGALFVFLYFVFHRQQGRLKFLHLPKNEER